MLQSLSLSNRALPFPVAGKPAVLRWAARARPISIDQPRDHRRHVVLSAASVEAQAGVGTETDDWDDKGRYAIGECVLVF